MNKLHVLVTGGAGYVGSVLVPKLLEQGHQVTVLDLYLYGESTLEASKNYKLLRQVKGDIRNLDTVDQVLEGVDVVVHLACISNDPSFELNPKLGKSINYDCFQPLVKAAKKKGVKRFIFASSSSVYGVKKEKNVTENLSLDPLTDYSHYKALCEKILLEEQSSGFTTLVLRPATICGYAPRLRLDLTVNILTNHAFNKGKITVFGGDQLRPNIHIEDMTDLYVRVVNCHPVFIEGKIFNVGYENYSVLQLAQIVRNRLSQDILLDLQDSDDSRSYHISSNKIAQELGFTPKHSIKDAVEGLVQAFSSGYVVDPLNNPQYYNIKTMQNSRLE